MHPGSVRRGRFLWSRLDGAGSLILRWSQSYLISIESDFCVSHTNLSRRLHSITSISARTVIRRSCPATPASSSLTNRPSAQRQTSTSGRQPTDSNRPNRSRFRSSFGSLPGFTQFNLSRIIGFWTFARVIPPVTSVANLGHFSSASSNPDNTSMTAIRWCQLRTSTAGLLTRAACKILREGQRERPVSNGMRPSISDSQDLKSVVLAPTSLPERSWRSRPLLPVKIGCKTRGGHRR